MPRPRSHGPKSHGPTIGIGVIGGVLNMSRPIPSVVLTDPLPPRWLRAPPRLIKYWYDRRYIWRRQASTGQALYDLAPG
jgi:hypothetical protein